MPLTMLVAAGMTLKQMEAESLVYPVMGFAVFSVYMKVLRLLQLEKQEARKSLVLHSNKNIRRGSHTIF